VVGLQSHKHHTMDDAQFKDPGQCADRFSTSTSLAVTSLVR
jgi:hypothetical protein